MTCSLRTATDRFKENYSRDDFDDEVSGDECSVMGDNSADIYIPD